MKSSKRALQSIKCECGFEINITPNLKKLGRTIEIHALSHALKEKSPDKAKAECDRIEDFLIDKVIKTLLQE
ncbi:MAG: hypothetical protein QXZ70_08595 [Candidatus Bathyarchaeia archaeon]